MSLTVGELVAYAKIDRKDFKEVRNGRPDFRGLPIYWRVEQRALHFWPCAAHSWSLALEIEDVATQEQVDERSVSQYRT